MINIKELEHKLMSIKQAAAHCGFSKTYVISLMRDGKLSTVNIDGKKLLLREEVVKFENPVKKGNPRRGRK